MIQTQIYLNVVENNGVQKLMCIRVLKASNKKYAHIGDVIIAMVKEAIPNMPLKKLEVVRAIVVCTCKKFKRKNGMSVRFNNNVAIIINQEGNPKGTLVFGPIA
jgi:large subunit ribosomal protein L14